MDTTQTRVQKRRDGNMSKFTVIEIIGIGIIFVVFLVIFSKRTVITEDIGMKNYKGYQHYGLTAAAFFNRMKASFQNDFHYPFERECPNYYFAKIYDEDPRYILVIDLGNLSTAVIVNEFQFAPKSFEIVFADGRTNRTVNWLTGKKFYVYQDSGWEMVSELERNDILDFLMEWGMESEIDMEHAYALSYPNAETASRTELALCRIAAKEFALRIAEKAGISLKFQE